MYGPDADELFAAVESHLRGFVAKRAYCALRYRATDPTALEHRFEL
jgi:hypothetical protein